MSEDEPPVTDERSVSAERPAAGTPPTEVERLVAWFDARTGAADLARGAMRKVFPDHWSFLLGEIALFSFVVLVLTGTYLTFFYVPDAKTLTYTGPYAPLQGSTVSAAFDSVMRLSFEVRGGLLMRQLHHWAALIFLGAIVVHACRIFFTGAFRRPRELNWLIGLGLFGLAMIEGLTGYSLPDDLLSGTGLRILDSVILSVPFLGPWLASLVFGGEFPTPEIISRLFVFHIMLAVGLLVAGITIHLALLVLQKHTQYRGGLAREENVVGRAFWPGQAFRSAGLFCLTFAVTAVIAGFVQINPVWTYGPYLPYAASTPAQPDWYMGWLEGAVRLGLPFEPTIFGVTIPELFLPSVVLPGLLFGLIAAWPWLEARLTGDHAEHHLLDLPWQQPLRLATGSAVLSAFLVLTLAAGNDVFAAFFTVPLEAMTDVFRILLVVVPVMVWLVAWRLAHELGRREGLRAAPPGGEPLARTPEGGFAAGSEGEA